MRIFLGALVLGLMSTSYGTSDNRTPNSVTEKDKIYICKNNLSNIVFVANVTDKIIKIYFDDKILANGLMKQIGELKDLEVRDTSKTRQSNANEKSEISYTFYKEFKGQRLSTTRPVFEIEMEKDMASGFVAYADGKVMGPLALDYDVEDLNCKRNKMSNE